MTTSYCALSSAAFASVLFLCVGCGDDSSGSGGSGTGATGSGASATGGSGTGAGGTGGSGTGASGGAGGGATGNILTMDGGEGHSLALQMDGTVLVFGTGFAGDPQSSVPIMIPSFDDVAQLESGDRFALARKNDGSWWGWGYAEFGNLGPNVVDNNQPEPLQIY